MPALRCTQCATNWPVNFKDYSPCPECDGPTGRFSNATAIPADEARSRKNHAEFERYLDVTGRRSQAEQLERALSAT